METVNLFHKRSVKEDGFALLMTIIVVSVIISIGLSVLDLSLKQIRLSTNAKDSEISFHAANAGVECARYVRRVNAVDMENGNTIAPSCFSVSPYTNTKTKLSSSEMAGDGDVFKYMYSFSWGNVADQRCTEITTMVASGTARTNATTVGRGVTTTNMTNHISGYPTNSGANWYCGPGERCTLIAVKGYNRSCSASYGYGTVEREVLLQF